MKKIYSLEKINKSNLFFLLEKSTDIEKLSFLKLSSQIKNNIQENIDKKETILLSYFLGTFNIDNLYIYIVAKNETKDIIYLLGEVFPKLPKNVTLLTNHTKNLEMLMNTSILSRYKYQEYKSKKDKDNYNFFINKDQTEIFESRKNTIENIIFARDLGNMPSNDLFPESFVKIIKETKFKNTKVKIFDYKKIQKIGMGLLEAVGKGSVHKPYMVVMERIIDKNFPTIGLVGKGVTFDTGGIQVKPGNFMYEMKGDMCGAANVFALAKELDTAPLQVNIVYTLMLAENHISGESFKPSDIFTSYSGKTVDIVHTDAEGRLVLADGISYISKNYKPRTIISLATLTGACMVALGFRYAGIMGNDEKLIKNFLDYSEKNFEKYYRLPFDDYFIDKTKSEVADLKNLTEGIYAGSSMGGAFLANFLLNKEKYVHLDIAGSAINSYEAYGYAVKGITGFGVDSMGSIIKNLK